MITEEVLYMLKNNAQLFRRVSTLFTALYILLFLTNGLGELANYSPWIGFLVALFLSSGGFILSVLAARGEPWFDPVYLVIYSSFMLILFTIYVFLLPEAGGVPPIIPLFFD